ncbi:MAG: hypothetical protein CVV20_04245 [Gemmatimonadetes bacterium HGW-Gemmatimonadetes-1]|nr:MAG: hypothetical protein CVV20_04245 [Gemmatimonadetes bacterium HGW-Gemmatimonadetes-1]
MFRSLFRASVERRLVSEVPVGSCLSGGVDSTTIVGLMSELLNDEAPDAASLRGQLKTFSAVFDGDPIDERAYIEVAVESTGADTTYTNPTSPEFIDELRDFVWHQEEPIVSTGPYAQWCVMRSAREQVTVLLDGQGGDELLAGYVALRAIGIEANFVDVLLLQTLITFLLYFAPTPGASGVAEVLSAAVMSVYLPRELTPLYTIIWRLILSWFTIAAGFFVFSSWVREGLRGVEVEPTDCAPKAVRLP